MNYAKKEKWKKMWPLLIVLVPVLIYLFICTVQYLWNLLMPEIFGLGTLTFWQAAGVLLLSKLLFGGFKSGGGKAKVKCRCCCGGGNSEEFADLSEEEIEKFKSKLKHRCC